MRTIEAFDADHRNYQCFYQSCRAFEEAILLDTSDKIPWRTIVVLTDRLSHMIWERENIVDCVGGRSYRLALSIFKWLGYLSLILIPWALKLAALQRSSARQREKICDQYSKIAHIWNVAANRSAEKVMEGLKTAPSLKKVALSLEELQELKEYASKIHRFRLFNENAVNQLYIPSEIQQVSKDLKETLVANIWGRERKQAMHLLLDEIEKRVFSLAHG